MVLAEHIKEDIQTHSQLDRGANILDSFSFSDVGF